MANFNYKILLLTGVLSLVALCRPGFAQGTASPFDLLPRVKLAAPTDTVAIAISSNPFDIVKVGPTRRRATVKRPGGFSILQDKTNKPLTVKEKETLYRRFLFVVVLSMFIILTLIVTIFRILIEKIWKAFFYDNMLNQLIREQSPGLALAYVILYTMFFINAGIFAFLATKFFGVTVGSSNFSSLMVCVGGIAAFFLAKHIVLWLLGFVFPIGKEVASYQFTILVFNITLGLFLVPFILFVAYAPAQTTTYVVHTALGLLGFTYLFLGMRGLFIANRFLAWHRFHFLLYLCAVEIAPLLVIVKLLLPYWGR